MMELIELQEDHIVGLCIDGKVDNETFDRVLAEIEDRLTRHERIRIYVELVSLGGIGLEALFKDMKFGLGNWRRFEREAVVSDRAWVHKIASLTDRLMPSVEVKAFPLEEKSAALAWVRE